ncbi:MAG: CRISPR-associated endonuclease Cas2, partial [Nanopusillaceae archaeon]
KFCIKIFLNKKDHVNIMYYVIIAYDISIERQDEVREFLKRYLNHIQNSVFEGELSMDAIYYIKKNLEKMIDKNKDSVIIYVLPGKGYIKEKIELGVKKEFGIY